MKSVNDGLNRRASRSAGMLLALGLVLSIQSAAAQDTRPYDDRLLRLSEILGAIHYLRELCGNNDGQLWRDKMRELMEAEGSSALRRAKLIRSFNNGYRSYSRTYTACSASAQVAVSRFLAEGTQIGEALMKPVP